MHVLNALLAKAQIDVIQEGFHQLVGQLDSIGDGLENGEK
jgi:hypothetical protein